MTSPSSGVSRQMVHGPAAISAACKTQKNEALMNHCMGNPRYNVTKRPTISRMLDDTQGRHRRRRVVPWLYKEISSGNENKLVLLGRAVCGSPNMT